MRKERKRTNSFPFFFFWIKLRNCGPGFINDYVFLFLYVLSATISFLFFFFGWRLLISTFRSLFILRNIFPPFPYRHSFVALCPCARAKLPRSPAPMTVSSVVCQKRVCNTHKKGPFQLCFTFWLLRSIPVFFFSAAFVVFFVLTKKKNALLGWPHCSIMRISYRCRQELRFFFVCSMVVFFFFFTCNHFFFFFWTEATELFFSSLDTAMRAELCFDNCESNKCSKSGFCWRTRCQLITRNYFFLIYFFFFIVKTKTKGISVCWRRFCLLLLVSVVLFHGFFSLFHDTKEGKKTRFLFLVGIQFLLKKMTVGLLRVSSSFCISSRGLSMPVQCSTLTGKGSFYFS